MSDVIYQDGGIWLTCHHCGKPKAQEITVDDFVDISDKWSATAFICGDCLPACYSPA